MADAWPRGEAPRAWCCWSAGRGSPGRTSWPRRCGAGVRGAGRARLGVGSAGVRSADCCGAADFGGGGGEGRAGREPTGSQSSLARRRVGGLGRSAFSVEETRFRFCLAPRSECAAPYSALSLAPARCCGGSSSAGPGRGARRAGRPRLRSPRTHPRDPPPCAPKHGEPDSGQRHGPCSCTWGHSLTPPPTRF